MTTKVLLVFELLALSLSGVKAQLCQQTVADLISQEAFATLQSSLSTTIGLHRNGEPEECGAVKALSIETLDKALQSFPSQKCPEKGQEPNKYLVESFLTKFLDWQFSDGECESTDTEKNEDVSGFLGFCDRGPDRTTPQPDSDQLIGVPSGGSLPCRFYTREGVRISSLGQLVTLLEADTQGSCDSEEEEESGTCSSGLKQLDLYAVPAGRVFMYAPKYVGEVFELSHVLDSQGNQLSLEVLSLNPRVFDIRNFFSPDEAEELVDKALRETSETHKLHRSTVRYQANNFRTSENAWDTHGAVAQSIKQRCMSTLGFDEYHQSHTDGLQIVRYNETNAYTQHYDVLPNLGQDGYDYQSAGKGGNRFATVLLYMNDVEEGQGGETLFALAPRAGEEPTSALDMSEKKTAMIRQLRDAGEIDMLEEGSWEERMTAECRLQMSVTPKKAKAILFYSQFPNGTVDEMSQHGGCPMLYGTKWAANLWAWNAARPGNPHAPYKPKEDTDEEDEEQQGGQVEFKPIQAVFSVQDPKYNGARLFWKDQDFGELAVGQDLQITTFKTAVWTVKDKDGQTELRSWTITKEVPEKQYFVVVDEDDRMAATTTHDRTAASVQAIFTNSGKDPKYQGARLFWHDQDFGVLDPTTPKALTTFASHVWSLRDAEGKETLISWTMAEPKDPDEKQFFTV